MEIVIGSQTLDKVITVTGTNLKEVCQFVGRRLVTLCDSSDNTLSVQAASGSVRLKPNDIISVPSDNEFSVPLCVVKSL